jgi:predicted SAM-dependent methyltransferase
MSLVAIAAVKNEVDVIEAFARHTLAFVNHLVILDNGSRDGTLDVLRCLEKEFDSLHVEEDPSLGKYQARHMTRLLHEHALGRHRAEWVLPLDADEFVVVPPGASLVPDGADPDRPVALRWRTYVPDPSDDTSQPNPVLRMRHRLVREGWCHHKVLAPGRLAARDGATLRQGSHDLLVGGGPAEAVGGATLLAHFPLRTPAQYLAKVAINCLQYLAMPDRDAGNGWHYRPLFDLLKHDARAFHAGFAEAARRYAVLGGAAGVPETLLDPLPYRGGPLKHTPPLDEDFRAWPVVLRHAEDLARRNAVFAACLREDGQAALDTVAAVFERLHGQAVEYVRLLHGEYVRTSQQQQEIERERGRQAELEDRLAGERRRSAELDRELGAARAREARLAEAIVGQQQEIQSERGRQAELENLLAQERQRSVELDRQLGAAQAHEARLAEEVVRVEQRLRGSWTWRAGRLLVAPVARVVRASRHCRRAGARVLQRARAWRSRPASSLGAARRIILGAGETAHPRWTATEQAQLDVTRREDFARHWQPGSRDAFLAEHVWEHLTGEQARRALAHCYEFLRPGGYLRIAVPDGLHPDPAYREWVRPGGNGPGADDHRVLYDHRSLRALLEEAGFRVRLLEYWTEQGEFRRRRWSAADGPVRRSSRYDPRNQGGVLRYTSLIADAFKPRAPRGLRRAA